MADKTTSVKVRLTEPLTLDRAYSHVTFRNYAYDPSLKGSETHCVVQGTIHSDDEMYFWWRNIKDNKQYKQEKERVAQEILAIAKKTYPDIADEMEVIDVVTPCTYERYLNSRHGSFQGFIHTQRGKALMQNGRIKGLDGFIMAGQWITQSGGLPAAAISGKYAAQRICKSDKKKFVDFE
jgi:phytoene dehydrogenase-like protein